MEILADLIKKAFETGLAEWNLLTVEVNGGVVMYVVDGIECTSSQACDYIWLNTKGRK